MDSAVSSGSSSTVDTVTLAEELRARYGAQDVEKILELVPAPQRIEVAGVVCWMHAKWHYTTYYFYTEYYFECSTRVSSDPNSAIFPVDQIILRWRHGQTRGQEVKDRAGFVGKSDRLYNVGPDTDCCVNGLISHQGASGFISVPEGCSYG